MLAQAVPQPVQVLQVLQPVQSPQRRLVSVSQEPPEQRLEQQRAPPPPVRQDGLVGLAGRQRPSNTTAQPQFLEPGVGRWLLNGDPSCLPCICEAATGCDETLGCDDRGFCGPFLLSQRYWTLAGKPLLRGDSEGRPGGKYREAAHAKMRRL